MLGYWDTPGYNANAGHVGSESTYEVNVYGGLLDWKASGEGALAAVICHEIGHILGGIAQSRSEQNGDLINISEGFADYFATQVCLKKYFSESVPSTGLAGRNDRIQQLCKNDSDPTLCTQVLNAAYDNSLTLAYASQNASGEAIPDFKFPSHEVATKGMVFSFGVYPERACRFDTMVAGYFGATPPKCFLNP